MDRRKFLGWIGKATAVAVVAPQVLAELKPSNLETMKEKVLNATHSYEEDDKFVDYSKFGNAPIKYEGGMVEYGPKYYDAKAKGMAEAMKKTQEQMFIDLWNKA